MCLFIFAFAPNEASIEINVSFMIEFEKGDKVRLKSIGPIMEVVAVEKNVLSGKVVSIECVWVSPKQKHYRERFKPEELIHTKRNL